MSSLLCNLIHTISTALCYIVEVGVTPIKKKKVEVGVTSIHLFMGHVSFFFLAGFNVETVEYKNISFTVWDVGGQDKVSNNCNQIAPFNSCCSFLGLYKCLT